ncbi:MAG: PRD domain-containing protein [Erysipelotrichaceae bacterium]|nr:PRD domain-containing protein [Erysipelotrichaceae bacterium]
MRKNRSREIIEYLTKNNGKVFTTEELSVRFGISQRQIRNYIHQINAEKEIIAFHDDRYSIIGSVRENDAPLFQSSAERADFIVSRLLSEKDAVDLYELADELFVSDATIQSDLKKVRKRLERFDLSLKNNASFLLIEGTEKNIRSLTSYMITNTRFKGFVSEGTNHFFDNDYQIDGLKKNLIRIFNDCSFYYNDYSLNNIILHLVITIDRLRNNYSIEETQVNLQISEIEFKAAEEISRYLEKSYDIRINPTEKNNIATFLATNLATLDYRLIDRENIASYIDRNTIDLVEYILNRICDYYLLDPFDDIFFARFCLHIDNLLKRQKIHHSVHNPMLMDIKMTYPLIFDIAVYAAGLIEEKSGYRINQDEISLIALHIGSFIESCDSNRNKLSAIYIYSDYHQFYQHNISTIQTRFADDINLLYTISPDDYDPNKMQPDLLISEVPMENAITVSPFITSDQIGNIEAIIKKKSRIKETGEFFASLHRLFNEDLFFIDIEGKDEFEVIHKLTDILKEKGLFGDDFVSSVISREKLSSTCFIRKVAIPHAIGQTIAHSFISVVTYEKNQKWGNEDIQLLILFGISYAERKDFRFVFNHLVDILNDEANVNILCRCRSYAQIMEFMDTMMNKI